MPQQHMVEHAILLLPPLLPPKGVQTISGSGGSGGTGLSASTRLRDSTMTPGALLAHYVAQLVRAGWTVHPPTATAAFALQALEARDKDGVPWYGMMLVIATRDARSISVMMNRTPNQ